MAKPKKQSGKALAATGAEYSGLLSDVSALLDAGRQAAARVVNVVLTATYWEVGRRIVEFEQGGKARAGYGEALLQRLAEDLSAQHGRGFSERNLRQIRAFYLGWEIRQTPSAEFVARVRLPQEQGKRQTPSATSAGPAELPHPAAMTTAVFPLPWSHYVRLLSLDDPHARHFYEQEAVRGAWSVRQLARQVNSQFYERTALSKDKAAMLTKGQAPKPGDAVTVEEQIRDPFVLEFLGLKDEYAENDLEAALVHHLETFLLELGGDFTFVGRQKRLRLDDKWFKVDLVFFHRVLRCLVLIDLKIGEFSHADAGQMNMYLNYARAHWVRDGENPPVGLILCAKKGHDEARYALEGLGNKVLTSTYRTTLPDADVLVAEVEKTRRMLELKAASGPLKPK
jgi:predicted nuclease of restriction endonuclease-like (RecB) superfamily